MAGSVSGVLLEQNGQDVDITLLQGKTIGFTVIYGGDTPIDITGYTARLQARRDPCNTLMVEFTNANSRIVIGGVNGVITISMTATDSAALAPFEGYYDMELVNGSVVYQPISGKFRVLKEVTV